MTVPYASEQRGPRARVIAIANQKGGVGKSTTAVNLGASLAETGKRVLVIDLDPQGNASTGLGIDHADRRVTTYQVVVAGADPRDAVVTTQVEGLSAIPSTIDLAGAEIELVSQFSREGRLARAIDALSGEFDVILLDCPPSLGLLTVNALTAADELMVPIQCEYYALEGLGQLLRNVRLIQQNVNPRLRLTGIVMTMFDRRTRLADQVVNEVRAYFGSQVYDVVIPRSIRLAEAPGFGKPITVYDPSSAGAAAYRELAKELLSRPTSDGIGAFDLERLSEEPLQVERLEQEPTEGDEEGPSPEEPEAAGEDGNDAPTLGEAADAPTAVEAVADVSVEDRGEENRSGSAGDPAEDAEDAEDAPPAVPTRGNVTDDERADENEGLAAELPEDVDVASASGPEERRGEEEVWNEAAGPLEARADAWTRAAEELLRAVEGEERQEQVPSDEPILTEAWRKLVPAQDRMPAEEGQDLVPDEEPRESKRGRLWRWMWGRGGSS